MMKGEDLADTSEGAFGSKSTLARISVIAAGPIFNFIMAFLIAVVLVGMIGYDPATISGVMEGYPAQEAGLQAGDTIISMNGKRIYLGREISNYLSFHPGEEIRLVYERDGERYSAILTPKLMEDSGLYYIGITRESTYVKANLPEDLKYGAAQVRFWIDITIESLKMLVRGQVGVEDMSGPVGVVNMIGDTYTEAMQYGWFDVLLSMMNIAILLSANLGVMNLLPIPALDGGRLFFLLIELIRGKRIDPRKEGIIHFAGFILLLFLMVVVMFNDVLRLF